jgi:uncharacterized repeat protein (TIGR03803 family)
MNRPAAHAVIATALLRYGLSLGAAAALLTGCGGSQIPLGASPQGLGPQQALAQRAYHIIHPFGRSMGDGKNPAADLINIKGTLYGTTVGGGSHGAGTVFSITTNGEENVLHSFGRNAHDGGLPMGRLLNVNGTLYGTTAYGGKNDGGTVFSMTLSGSVKVVHSFDSTYSYTRNGGAVPRAGLINVNGTLYGTTALGGDGPGCASGDLCGTVFSVTKSGQFKLLHNFGKGSDGSLPQAPLLDVNGTLYGTTTRGGEHTNGTIFSITTAGDYTTLYSFGGTQNDGRNPMSALINVQGLLYGTTNGGGSGTQGTVFSITTDGSENIVYSFASDGADGVGPTAALKNVKGVLYGTTSSGGVNDVGTVFKLTKSGKETVVHSFDKGDGVNPVAGVIAVGGTLYGTTYGRTVGMVRRSYGDVYSLTK